MPRESCIRHTGGFFKFNDDFHSLLAHDSVATIVLGIFEFWTNGELSRMERLGKKGEPWIEASVNSICEEARSQCSDKPVREALKRLGDLGFLKSEPSPGAVKRYLLNVSRVQEFLDFRSGKITEVTGGDLGKSTEGSGNSVGNFTAPYKEEEVRTKEENLEHPLGETSEPQPQNPEVLAQDLVDSMVAVAAELVDCQDARRMFVQAGYRNPSAKERREASEIWGDQMVTQQRFGEVIGWAKLRDRPPTFVHISRILVNTPTVFPSTQRLPQHRALRVEDVRTPPAESTPPRARLGQVPIGEGGLPEPVLAWNSIVKHGNPLTRWKTSNGDHSMLTAAWSDPDFRDNLILILEKCEGALTSDAAKWGFVTFTWLLKLKDGNPNWFRVLQGEYDYMAKSSAKKPEPAYQDPYDSL